MYADELVRMPGASLATLPGLESRHGFGDWMKDGGMQLSGQSGRMQEGGGWTRCGGISGKSSLAGSGDDGIREANGWLIEIGQRLNMPKGLEAMFEVIGHVERGVLAEQTGCGN
jgi:hypothetical protein